MARAVAARQPDILGPVLIAAAVLLTLLTVLNFFVLDRYAVAGGTVSVLPAGGVVLTNDAPDGIARREFPVPLDPDMQFIRLTAVAEGFDIVPGGRAWHRGRIVFLRSDPQGRHIWDLPHVVALLKGNPVRWTFTEIFRSDREASALTARLELLKATGTLKVYSLTATPMREAHGFRAALNALLAGWIALGLGASWWVWRRVRRGRWLTGLAWLVCAPVLILSVLPADTTAAAGAVAVKAVDLVASETATVQEKTAAVSSNMFSIAKLGHVIMFLGVGFAIGLARGRSSTVGIWLLAVGYACLCEMLQLYSPNRAPAGFDLMLNSVSATAGFGLSWVLLRIPVLRPRFRP
ncbi:VanZ family protein [Minwuia sp.]|uniref:VanZ family protein n=1 Tax=Minwuia sp. TaxID=2493630 RepID=UPI003A904035